MKDRRLALRAPAPLFAGPLIHGRSHGAAPELEDLGDLRPVCGRQLARSGEGGVAAAVVDIHDLGRQAARRLEGGGDLDDARVQGGEIGCLVEQRHHDGKTGVRRAPRSRGGARPRAQQDPALLVQALRAEAEGQAPGGSRACAHRRATGFCAKWKILKNHRMFSRKYHGQFQPSSNW